MSEKAPNVQLPEELNAYDGLEAQVASDGSRRVYGIDADGKKKQLKGDDVLEAYGYSAKEVNKLSESTNSGSAASNPYEEDFKDKFTSALLHSKVDVDGTAKNTEYLTPVISEATRRGIQGESGKDLLLDEYKKQSSTEGVDSPMDVYAAKLKQAEVVASTPQTLYEDLFDEDREAPKAEEEKASDTEGVNKDYELLSAMELADELAFARITGDEEKVSKISSLINKKINSESESLGMSSSDKSAFVASVIAEKDQKEISYLLELDKLDITDQQREHAREYKNVLNEKQILKMYELTKRQKAILLDASISDEERERIDGELTDQFERILNLHALLNGYTDEQKQGLRDEIAKNVINNNATVGKEEDTVAAEKAPDQTEEPAQNRLRNRWRRIKAGVYTFPDRVKAAIREMKDNGSDEQKKWIKRGLIGAAAVAGAGVIAVLSNKHGIDINPFDGDGFDLNPFNNNDIPEMPGTGGSKGTDNLPADTSGLASSGSTGSPEIVQGLEFKVRPGQGTSHVLSEIMDIDFGNNVEQWDKFNELTNPLFEGLPGTYTQGGTVFLNEGANLSLTPEIIEKVEAARKIVTGG